MNRRRQELYSNLRAQVLVAKEAIDIVSVENSKVKIGNSTISTAEFNSMVNDFLEIIKANGKEIPANIVDRNVIPIVLINNDKRFKAVQVTLNEIRRDKAQELYDNER